MYYLVVNYLFPGLGGGGGGGEESQSLISSIASQHLLSGIELLAKKDDERNE